jgi:hypothetical protein
MPRPHIEFVQAQQLPWRPAAFGRGWEDVEAKVLSRDPGDGACTALLRYPPGWRRGPHALAASFELFVLDGAFERDGVRHGLDAYAYFPARHACRSFATEAGAVVLAFLDREPGGFEEAQTSASTATDGLVAHLDTHELPWTSADIDPSVQFLRLSHKVLRRAPETGERTVLLATGAQTHPRGWREAQLKHDCVEEMYLLGGDIVSERGTMYEGAYFWRPPGIWHGPFGSRRGSLSLIRLLHGRHANIWSQHEHEFRLDPVHAPVLPVELEPLAAAPWAPQRY